eukprot:gene58339-biopygen121259
MRSRAQQLAASSGQRLYWCIAADKLSGAGARRAWADRTDLAEQKAGWLTLDDKKTARRLGILPIFVGCPVYLNDHLHREKGLVSGLQGTVTKIWFDGEPPTKPNSQGEYVCDKIPTVVVKFDGFDAPVPIRPTSKEWNLAKAGSVSMATRVRRLQLPIVPDFGSTARVQKF